MVKKNKFSNIIFLLFSHVPPKIKDQNFLSRHHAEKIFTDIVALRSVGFLYPVEARAQGWTFTESVSHSGPGPCIPYVPFPSIVYGTKEACEYNRQGELNNNGDDWSLFGDGSCLVIITCTPCVGGDPNPSGPGGSSTGIPEPGTVSLEGLLAGKPFFSAHESRAVEELLDAYVQKMKSMGVTVDKNALLAAGDVPLTGNAEFDRYWVEQLMKLTTFKHGTAVNLTDKKGLVDPADLKQPEDKTVTTYKTKTEVAAPVVQIPGSDKLWYHLEPIGIPPVPVSSGTGNFRYDHPRIDLVRESAVTVAGWLPDGAAYPGILAVNIWAENAKAIQDFRDGNIPQGAMTSYSKAYENTVTDWKKQAIGDVQGKITDKLIDIVGTGTGIAKLASNVIDYNSKWQDLGGEVAGGEGPGIFGQITKAATWLGQPTSSAGL